MTCRAECAPCKASQRYARYLRIKDLLESRHVFILAWAADHRAQWAWQDFCLILVAVGTCYSLKDLGSTAVLRCAVSRTFMVVRVMTGIAACASRKALAA
jgi:hypothetical protein